MQPVTTSVQIVLPQHCNGYAVPRLFGGQMMAWIDIVAAVAARRYAGQAVTTVCVDHLTFIAPAHLNDTVVQEARVTWAGRTSLEVRVDSYAETLSGTRVHLNRAYAVFVAIDDEERPSPVPPFTPDGPEEQAEYEAALVRREQRMGRK